MPKRGTLNVAMIGYGFMGRAHSNAFRQVNSFFDASFDLRLKVICGRNEDNLRRMAAEWGWQEMVRHWESVVARSDIDVVDICAPNYLHAPIAIAAAEAGKIILCEKPLANTVEEAERMVDAARGRGTLVWFNYRRVPAVRFARELVEQGRLGQVYHYRGLYLQSWGRSPGDPAAWRFQPDQAGSGVMGDLLSHSLDLAVWLNGSIRRLCSNVCVFAEGRQVDDGVSVLAEFANGSMGTFEATRFAMGNQNRNTFEINGSRGALEFNLEKMNHLQFNDLGEDASVQGRREILVTGPGHPYVDHFWPPGHVIGYEHTFIATLADFLHALRHGERFRPDFTDALEVQRLLEAVFQSDRCGNWVETPQLEIVS
jgi:predicted dehydrogenase